MNNFELENIINHQLNISSIADYAPNGLQIEGQMEVIKIITGVTASQALIDYTIQQKAQALLVHHGYFWKSEPPVLIGMKAKRIKSLFAHNINLYAYHLPLDIHPILGNNAQLAKLLSIENLQDLEIKSPSIPIFGKLPAPITGVELKQRITHVLKRAPLYCGDNAPALISSVAICTGGGQNYIDLAAKHNIDAFITGEVSEQTIHSAREQGIHFFAAGHHATERYGIKALGEWLAQHYNLTVEFKDIDNPA